MKKSLRIILVCMMGACLLLSSCGAAEESGSYSQGLYAGEVQEADVFIDIPNLRQYGTYTCGATCVQMIMNWIKPYEGDMNLTAYEEALGTNEEAGTPPENMLEYFEQNEISITAKAKRTMNDLKAAIDKGHPVLMCIQAWAAAEDGYNTENPDDEDTYLTEGHWVICVGYKKLDSGYTFYFNDPACVGYCLMSEEELDDRWIDMDTGGNIYNHYGIEINETGQDYNPKGVYHLD